MYLKLYVKYNFYIMDSRELTKIWTVKDDWDKDVDWNTLRNELSLETVSIIILVGNSEYLLNVNW